MSRHRVSKAEGAAVAALVMLTFAAIAALAVALFKAAVVIFRWLATTADDWRSGVPARVARARARLATLATAAYVLVAYGFLAAHVGQSPWHVEHASWELPGAALAVAVGALSFLTWRALTGLGRRASAPALWATSGVAAIAALGFAAVDAPSRAEVEALVRRGNVNDARTAVSYLEQAGQTPGAAAALADQLHEREVNEAPDLAAKLMALRAPWRLAANEARVRGAIEASVTQQTRELLARNDAAGLDRLTSISHELPAVDPQVRASARLAHAAAKPDDATSCPATDYAELARTLGAAEVDPRRAQSRARAEALFQRLEREAAASEERGATMDAVQGWTRVEGAARCVQALGGADVLTPLDLPTRLGRLQRVAEREYERNERVRQREDREAERQQRREEREAERQRRREERNRGGDDEGSACGSHLSCCDGSCSPSCRTDRDSYRGCCSHHGGVCN